MDVQEQLCYIPCNFCSIVLAVSVPCSSLFDVVTVRCGHCTNLWNVNMAAAFQCTLPSNSNSSSQNASSVAILQPQQAPNLTSPEYKVEFGSSSKWNNVNRIPIHSPNANNKLPEPRIVNRPPEKRQRVPSAYNQFIKEEIQRIKANNPEISHREAFSSAAKNWAHFPHIHFGLMLETNNQAKLLNEGRDQKHKMRRTSAFLNK